MNTQILYLFDPLCGWCYGFSDTFLAFYHQHQSDFEFVAVPGGMFTGDRVAPYHSMKDFISGSYKRIEEMTGVSFGEKYISELVLSDTMLDSEPPSRAIITFRSFQFDQGVAFAHALQKAHFLEGKNYNDKDLYQELAGQFGLDGTAFMMRYHDERIGQNLQQEFAWVRESGVQGYPTVVLRAGSKYYTLTHGFAPLDQLNHSLEKATKMLG